MCRPDSSKKQNTNSNGVSSMLNCVVSISLLVYTIGFVFFRIGELVPLYYTYRTECRTAIIGTLVLRFTLSSRVAKYMLHIISLAALIYVLDHHAIKPLPDINNSLYTGKTVVITGGNSGLGFETARQLSINYGTHVIMGCRSEIKCTKAASTINNEITATTSNGSVTPMIIDLANLDSVKSFATQLEGRKVDVLFNNAGYAPSVDKSTVNDMGLNPAFNDMHLAHFYLSEQLLKEHPRLRVVYTSSGTHHCCALPFAFVPSFVLELLPDMHRPGCIDDEYLSTGIRSPNDAAAYFQCKLANVLHSIDIPRHHPHATSVAIDLGWVGTSIQPWMQTQLSPTSLGLMRSANVGVLPMIIAILSTDDELLDGLSEGRKLTEGGIIMNTLGKTEEALTMHSWRETIHADLTRERMVEVANKLWDESVKILKANGY